MIALLIIASHLVGDFVLQDHAMASRKASCSIACLVHVMIYTVTITPACSLAGLELWQIALIGIQHFVQDRFSLHVRWMKFYGQTPPDKWPTGPLCVDQAMHLGAIALISQLSALN